MPAARTGVYVCGGAAAEVEGRAIQGLQQRLNHVLWIGGATDAGKTTVAQYLAARSNHHLSR